jgi:hypothetical protein
MVCLTGGLGRGVTGGAQDKKVQARTDWAWHLVSATRLVILLRPRMHIMPEPRTHPIQKDHTPPGLFPVPPPKSDPRLITVEVIWSQAAVDMAIPF